ncbi:hypothetical protein FDENT_4555 [Fusarium denticulatum]|uniref:B30.2/SPRY domain-containing protein n=1 Tax=Fusarium denticulatum TaxID=48507 RepID=A0A8H5UKH7_9HYPO|nr:hypothetical protein FDENT_4555 [Fusarium denticulatum]
MWLFCWLLSAQAVAAADDAEFAFNLFSDIAPILALFGDQFAKQFMSESLTWYDHIIFAMVPLGIVTTVVGAIRVQGSPRLRAFIGYARENKAFAEIELMSSTSHEVGEIFNGKSIVRVMGRPEVRQLLIYPEGYQGYGVDDASPPGVTPEISYYHTIETMKEMQNLQPKELAPPLMKSSHQIQDNSQLLGSNTQGNSSAISILFSRSTQIQRDEESNSGARDLIPPRKTVKSDDSSKTFESPNLRLNISSEDYHEGKFRGSYRLKLASIGAVILQLGLIAIAGAVEYRVSNKGSELLESKRYGFPCFTIGSFLLCFGTGLCSWVIEQSTSEEIWEPSKDAADKKCVPQLVWVQQAQKVNDQYFDGYIIFAGRKSRIIKSRRWIPEKSPGSQNKDNAITTHAFRPGSPPIASSRDLPKSLTVADSQSCDRRSGIRKMKIHESFSWKRVASLISLFCEKVKPKRREVITLVASISAALGFILQFMGLRGLAFPSSIAQLIAILIMAGVRAWTRKGLGKEIYSRSAATGYELDTFATCLFLNQPNLSREEAHKETPGENPPEQLFHWGIMTLDIRSPVPIEYENGQRSVDLIKIRKRLGGLCKWRSKAFNSAQCLARCVELFMNEFFLSKKSVEKELWKISSVRQGIDDAKTTVSDIFSIPLRRSTSDTGTQRRWKVDDEIVEATLSLWMASIVAKKKRKDEKSGDWRRTKAGDDLKYTFRRIIGGSSKDSVLQRDISWWIGDIITDQGDKSMDTEVAATVSKKSSRASEVPDITIGLNGRGRDYENTAENELSITKDADLQIILAQHLFTRFVWAVVGQWSLVRFIGRQLQSEHVKVEGLRTFGGFNFEQLWQQQKLSHPKLTRLASQMESLGLGSTTDILLCIIPALSSQNLLPNDILLTRIPPIDPNQGWMNLLRCYTELLDKATGFQKQDKLRSSVTIHAMEFLYQAFHAYDRFNRISFDQRSGLQDLTRALISRSRKQKRFFTRLSQVYRVQKRLDTFEQVFRLFRASDKEVERLGLVKLKLIKQKSFKSFAVKYLNFSDDHTLFCFYREPELVTSDSPGSSSGRREYRQKDVTEDEKKEQSKRARTRAQSLDLTEMKKQDIFGWTPLHYACATGHANVLLLDNIPLKAELPRLVENFLRTPFHIAAACMDNAFEKLCHAFSGGEELKEAFLAGDRIGLTTFHLIAQTGNEADVRTFLSSLRNASVRKAIAVTDTFGRQPLHVAAHSGRNATVKMLIEKSSCDINAKDENGRTALHLAITAGHTETARILLGTNKCKINAADEDGKTILQTATLAGQTLIVKLLVDKDCVINARDEDGRTALHLALSQGHVSIALLLIDGKQSSPKGRANLQAKDIRGITTLMYAAQGMSRQLEEPQSTVASGAAEDHGKAPSLSPFSQMIFDYLIDNGPATEELDSDKKTALHHAILASNEPAALYLLDQPVSKKTKIVYNTTDSILAQACRRRSGFGLVVEKIVARFPGLINQRDSLWNLPPISWACKEGNNITVTALLDYRPSGGNESLDINLPSPDYLGWTPLHFAIRLNNEAGLELLLQQPTLKFDIKDDFGNTPLQYAVSTGYYLAPQAKMAHVLLATASFPDSERIRQLKSLGGCSPDESGGLVERILSSFRSELQLNSYLLDLAQTSSVKMPTEVSHFVKLSLLGEAAQDLQNPFHRAVILGDPGIFEQLENTFNVSDRADQVDTDNWFYQDYAIALGRHEFAKVLPKRISQCFVPGKMDWRAYHDNVQVTTCSGHAGQECSYMNDVAVVKAHPYLTRACIRSVHPIPTTQGKARCFYFEIQVLENSESGIVGIGFCGNDAEVGKMPGWFVPSWALHGDDGLLFINSGRGLKPSSDFGTNAVWKNGDVIGVQLNMDTGVGVCTLNGRVLKIGDAFGAHSNSFRLGIQATSQ